MINVGFVEAERGAWAHHRPPAVLPADLDDLSGPVSGTVDLPGHLAWSGPRTLDIGAEGDARWMYALVIREAATPDDLQLLNRHLLERMWPTLNIPVRHRSAWESRFPSLRLIRPAA